MNRTLLMCFALILLEIAITTSAYDIFTGSLRGGRYSRYRYGRYYDSEEDSEYEDSDDRSFEYGRYRNRNRNRNRNRYRYSEEDDDDDDDYRYSYGYRRRGYRRSFGGGRYDFYGNRRYRDAKNEDILRGLSGPKRYGDSCILKPRYINRRQDSRELPVNIKDLRSVLRDCDRNLLHFAIDSNKNRISGAGEGGCVYRRPDIGLDHWSPDPNAYLNTPFYTRDQRRRNRRYRVRKYRCGSRRLLYNQIHVATEKEYCRRLRRYTVTPFCNACEYSAIISRRDNLKSCTRRKLKDARSPALVHHYMNVCTLEFGKRERRC